MSKATQSMERFRTAAIRRKQGEVRRISQDKGKHFVDSSHLPRSYVHCLIPSARPSWERRLIPILEMRKGKANKRANLHKARFGEWQRQDFNLGSSHQSPEQVRRRELPGECKVPEAREREGRDKGAAGNTSFWRAEAEEELSRVAGFWKKEGRTDADGAV